MDETHFPQIVCLLINSNDAAAQISGQSSAPCISDLRTMSVYAQDVGSLHKGRIGQ
jgi:hypothetical protein